MSRHRRSVYAADVTQEEAQQEPISSWLQRERKARIDEMTHRPWTPERVSDEIYRASGIRIMPTQIRQYESPSGRWEPGEDRLAIFAQLFGSPAPPKRRGTEARRRRQEGGRMDSDEIVEAIRSLEATVQHLAAIQKGQTTAIEKMTRDLPTGLARALGLPKGQGVVVPRLRVRPEPDTQPAPATTDGQRRRRAGRGAADGNGTT